MSIMCLPPTTGQTTVSQGGRTYVGVAGTPQLLNDADAAIVGANGWTLVGKGGGTTAQRPTLGQINRGYTYTDTTVGGNIVWDGATWRNPATGASV